MPSSKHNQTKSDHISWKFQEYEKYEHGRKWYLVAAILCALILVYSILTRNFLFAFIVIMFGIIMVIKQRNQPAKIEFKINHQGIELNQKNYPYSDLANFWIIYDPPAVKTLYFSLKSGLKPRLSIPLENQNPLKIKNFLRQYLEEDLDQETEPASDAIGRLLKL